MAVVSILGSDLYREPPKSSSLRSAKPAVLSFNFRHTKEVSLSTDISESKGEDNTVLSQVFT